MESSQQDNENIKCCKCGEVLQMEPRQRFFEPITSANLVSLVLTILVPSNLLTRWRWLREATFEILYTGFVLGMVYNVLLKVWNAL